MAKRALEERKQREEALRQFEEQRKLEEEEQQRLAEEERVREEQEKMVELQQQVWTPDAENWGGLTREKARVRGLYRHAGKHSLGTVRPCTSRVRSSS